MMMKNSRVSSNQNDSSQGKLLAVEVSIGYLWQLDFEICYNARTTIWVRCEGLFSNFYLGNTVRRIRCIPCSVCMLLWGQNYLHFQKKHVLNLKFTFHDLRSFIDIYPLVKKRRSAYEGKYWIRGKLLNVSYLQLFFITFKDTSVVTKVSLPLPPRWLDLTS